MGLWPVLPRSRRRTSGLKDSYRIIPHPVGAL